MQSSCEDPTKSVGGDLPYCAEVQVSLFRLTFLRSIGLRSLVMVQGIPRANVKAQENWRVAIWSKDEGFSQSEDSELLCSAPWLRRATAHYSPSSIDCIIQGNEWPASGWRGSCKRGCTVNSHATDRSRVTK